MTDRAGVPDVLESLRRESEKERTRVSGLKRLFMELWTLLGRRFETPLLILQMEGCFVGRRVNEYVWLVRKCRCSDITKQSPYFMLVPDSMIVERELKSLSDEDYFDFADEDSEEITGV